MNEKKSENSNHESLKNFLKQHLHLNKAKSFILARFILAIIQQLTVTLSKLTVWIGSKSKNASKYKQLQRLITELKIPKYYYCKFITWIIWSWPYNLTLDRTNRKFGKANINILTLWITHKWIAIPILRMMLDKRWNSDSQERITLITEFMELVWKSNIASVLADREFTWILRLQFLKNNQIPFDVRLRNNFIVKWKHIGKTFEHWALYQTIKIKWLVYLQGVWLYIEGMKTKDDMLILAHYWTKWDAIELYQKRREIETLFGCLKSRWFNFEDTHVTIQEKISNILTILSIAFTWCYISGIWKNTVEPIPIKKHWRKLVSLFRYWLDLLREVIIQKADIKPYLLLLDNKLSCT